MKNEEELEFIAVGADEDNDMNTYIDPNNAERANSAIGGWIFTQSKVSSLAINSRPSCVRYA